MSLFLYMHIQIVIPKPLGDATDAAVAAVVAVAVALAASLICLK